MRRIGFLAIAALGLSGCVARPAPTPASPGDLRFSAHAVIEAAPVHYAIRHRAAARLEVPNGAIPSLYRPNGGIADLAGHADTQALKHSLTWPDLRIILTVTEGHYRIVARRSAGIRMMADLRGKRIATVPDSSAAFYLNRALASAGMSEADVTIVPLPLPPKDSARMLIDGRADALALWDPEPEIALHELGGDAVVLDPASGYRELYNLHSTAAKLADPTTRAKIVRFVATLIAASQDMRKDRRGAIALAAQVAGYSEHLIAGSWPQHAFPARLSPDLLDTLVLEEAWLAGREGRAARTRDALAALIDPSIEAEARALLRQEGRTTR